MHVSMQNVNGPLVRKEGRKFVDYEAFDKATKNPVATNSWFSRREKQSQVKPRVSSYAFDPYTQARPDLYSFQRDSMEPRIYYVQMRTDQKYMGSVEATAMGEPRAWVTNIDWHNVGGANMQFKMIGTNTNLPPVAEGYCKLTDIGVADGAVFGKLGWIAEITRLHGKDIVAAQTEERLFSLPLFEAVATGVAFGQYESDSKLRLTYPELGIMSPAPGQDAHASGIKVDASDFELNKAMANVALAPPGSNLINTKKMLPSPSTLASGSPPPWLITNAINSNLNVEQSHTYVSTSPFHMEVSHNTDGQPIGAILPMRQPVHILRDGMTVQRMTIYETPVKYHEYPNVKGISQYNVDLYCRVHASGTKPAATLTVAPVAMKNEKGNLSLRYHVTKPKLGTRWADGDISTVVGESEVEHALTRSAFWDKRLHSSIEVAMYKMRVGEGGATVEFVVPNID
jgi:hypothetical protein